MRGATGTFGPDCHYHCRHDSLSTHPSILNKLQVTHPVDHSKYNCHSLVLQDLHDSTIVIYMFLRDIWKAFVRQFFYLNERHSNSNFGTHFSFLHVYYIFIFSHIFHAERNTIEERVSLTDCCALFFFDMFRFQIYYDTDIFSYIWSCFDNDKYWFQRWTFEFFCTNCWSNIQILIINYEIRMSCDLTTNKKSETSMKQTKLMRSVFSIRS